MIYLLNIVAENIIQSLADYIICICSNMKQVKKALRIMKSWCEKNEMKEKKINREFSAY